MNFKINFQIMPAYYLEIICLTLYNTKINHPQQEFIIYLFNFALNEQIFKFALIITLKT